MLKIALIAVILYYVFKWVRRGLFIYRANRDRAQAPQKGAASELVKCARCSTYVSKNEAVCRNGEWICSTDCLK